MAIPAAYLTTWAPGVRGIPHRTTIFTTIDPATYGNGTVNATDGIQAAINACPVGQVVQLMAGLFMVNDLILINKAITLRGSGTGVNGTILRKTNQMAEQEQIIIVGPSRFPRIDESTAVNLVSDGVKGAFSVTVANAAGFAAGQFVKLDEDDYTTASFQLMPHRISGSVQSALQSDRLSWPIHSPPNELGELPVPDGLSWFSRMGRPMAEIKEIQSVAGNVITFTTPLHITYELSKTPQLVRYTGADNVFVTYAGVEDLVTDSGADGNISFLCAAYSWARNVEVKNYGNPGIDIRHGFRLEIRDSYIHDTVAPYPGGGGYALSLSFGASEVLIENNIIIYCNKPMVARSAGAGSVVGYNYCDDALINYNPGWQEVGLNASHMLGGHHVLFEGNRCFNYDSDETWGSAIYMVIFRNHLTGKRRSFTDTDNVRAGGLAFGSWWHAFQGNVMGLSGQMAGWVYDDPGDGTYGNSTSVWGVQTKAIWRIGYSTLWEQSPDPLTVSRCVRDGNWDYVTNTVVWENAPETLPDSLYLSSKPAFFGASTWPWVDVVGSTKTYSLPAYDRYTLLIGGSTPVFSSGTGTTFTVGVAGAFTVAASPNVTAIARTTGTLPTGVTYTDFLNGTASLAGMPVIGTEGTYGQTFVAVNSAGQTAQSFVLTVAPSSNVGSPAPVDVANLRLQGIL